MTEVRVLQLIWLAFQLTPLLLAFLAFGGPLPPPPPGDVTIIAALGAAAFMTGAFGIVGVPLLLRGVAAQSAFIVRFACAETVGVLGLVAHISGASMPVVASFLGISFGLTLILRPTERSYTHWEVRRLS